MNITTTTDASVFAFVPLGSIVKVVFFTRTRPRCPYCDEAEALLREHFPGITVERMDMSSQDEKFLAAWTNLCSERPDIKTVPQIFIHYDVDGDPRCLYVGGASRLREVCNARENALAKC